MWGRASLRAGVMAGVGRRNCVYIREKVAGSEGEDEHGSELHEEEET